MRIKTFAAILFALVCTGCLNITKIQKVCLVNNEMNITATVIRKTHGLIEKNKNNYYESKTDI